MDLRFEVAVLAGGAGTRLRARSGDVPKALVPIGGVPALIHQLALCRRYGFGRVLLLVHHGHDAIRDQLGDGTTLGVTIAYELEQTPRGTAGALQAALPRLADTFLVLYGDTYVDVDLRRMWDAHARRRADVTLFVHPSDHPADSDLVEVDEAGLITAWHSCPHTGDRDLPNLASAALLVVQKTALYGAHFDTDRPDLSRHAFPTMIARGLRLHAYRSPEYIKDFGTPERLDRVERDVRTGVPERLSARSLRAAVFLDRDGTLNREMNFVRRPDEVELLGGVPEAIRRVNHSGRLAVVITNQSIVARGEVTREGLQRIHARFDTLLGAGGAYLDAVYACPHHPDSGFPGEVPELKVRCDCRKPGTGSIDAACRDLLIDRRLSWFIGDTTSDIETGRRAGLKTILVRTGHAGRDGRFALQPDYVLPDLSAAVSWILEGHATLAARVAPVAAAAMDARLVLIGGAARSGKSSAAQILKEGMAAFGRTAHVLPLDTWLKPKSERSEGTGVISRFDTAAIAATLGPLIHTRERHRLELPIYDLARQTITDRRGYFAIAPEDLVIVEGVPALLIRELSLAPAIRVHVEMPEERRAALLRADYRWRGVDDAAVDALLASRAADEAAPLREARARADFVVSGWTAA